MCDGGNDDDGGKYPECFEAAMLVKGCNFPWIREFIDDEKCGQTYAERISPNHTIWCTIDGFISGALFLTTGLWFVNAYQDWSDQKQRGRLYRMRMHGFCSAACFFNLLASVDLKAVAARLPLLVVEVCNELAYSCLLCVMFHMVNQWVDVITLGGRTLWGKRMHALLPISCATVTMLRVGLGVAQWKVVPNGVHRGAYNGTLNNVKLFTSFFAMASYTFVGLYVSVYEPLKVKKAAAVKTAAPAAQAAGAGSSAKRGSILVQLEGGLRSQLRWVGGITSSAAAKSADALKRKTVLHTRYLVGLFGILILYVLYLAKIASERVGCVETRNVPCSFVSENWWTNQGVLIILAVGYVGLSAGAECDPAKAGGCLRPMPAAQRKKALKAAAAERRGAEAAKKRQETSAARTAEAAAAPKKPAPPPVKASGGAAIAGSRTASIVEDGLFGGGAAADKLNGLNGMMVNPSLEALQRIHSRAQSLSTSTHSTRSNASRSSEDLTSGVEIEMQTSGSGAKAATARLSLSGTERPPPLAPPRAQFATPSGPAPLLRGPSMVNVAAAASSPAPSAPAPSAPAPLAPAPLAPAPLAPAPVEAESAHETMAGSTVVHQSPEDRDNGGWAAVAAEDGRAYYWHAATGETSWETPPGFVA